MSYVVAYKWTTNPQDATVDAAGNVDWSRAKPALSEYDAVAIEVSRQLADGTGTELVGVSVGAASVGAALAKKGVMSRGIDRALIVADDEVTSWNMTETARALATLVEQAGDANLLVTGDASVDESAGLIPALVAGYLQWPCFEDVVEVAATAEGFQVKQSVAGGVRTVSVTGPCVVAVTSDAVVPRIPGMKDILGAGKKPVESVRAAREGVNPEAFAIVGAENPNTAGRTAQVFAGDSAVADLISALRADRVL